ncbi:MAG: DUF2130 domain-containing protein, partial [Clostridia bacterium]|nr:DUF2130 domain-containing protein [Clostridia bacterium]
MQEIKCPNCGQVFTVDESGYAQIVQQVRDKEFAEELHRRALELEKKQESDLTIVKMEQEKAFREQMTKKENELAEKDRQIEQMKAQLSGSETEKKLAVTEAVQEKEKESDSALQK